MARTIDDETASKGRWRGGVPVIDMAGVEGEERQRIAEDIAEACETWGLFQVINHGIDTSLMQRAKEVSREFFALPEDQKLQFRWNQDSMDGYSHPNLKGRSVPPNVRIAPESLVNVFETDLSKHKDQWPSNPPAYRVVMPEYVKQTRALQEKILGLMSEMLGLEQTALQKRLGGPYGAIRHSIRINHYTPSDGSDGTNCLPAHTDPVGSTLMLADDVPGLEVKKDGQWVPVDPLANAFIFKVADQVEIISNGQYKSAEHRAFPHTTQERILVRA